MTLFMHQCQPASELLRKEEDRNQNHLNAQQPAAFSVGIRALKFLNKTTPPIRLQADTPVLLFLESMNEIWFASSKTPSKLPKRLSALPNPRNP